MNDEITISEQLDSSYRNYSRYVIEERAIPDIRDGLKPVQRRILFVGKKEAQKPTKVTTLAGSTMKFHPHGDAPLVNAASLMAQQFPGACNFGYFEGHGAFGGRITGKGIESVGAPRYVSVQLSECFKKVLLTDYSIVQKIPNYDRTREEIKHFLPIIPTILLNPIAGIAVGFATKIYPYNPVEIIENQIDVLKEKEQDEMIPWFRDYHGEIVERDGKIFSRGCFEFLRKTQIHIDALPVTMNREQFMDKMESIIDESEYVKDVEDESRDRFDFVVYLTRDNPYHSHPERLYEDLPLEKALHPNLTAIDTDGNIREYESPLQMIREFTLWRLKYFKDRYQNEYDKLEKKINRIKDFLSVAESDLISRIGEMDLSAIEAHIKDEFDLNDPEWVLSKPLQSFSQDNIQRQKEKLKKLQKELAAIEMLLEDREARVEKYIRELKELKKWFKKQI